MGSSHRGTVVYGRNQRISFSAVAAGLLLGVAVWLVYVAIGTGEFRSIDGYLLAAFIVIPTVTTFRGEGLAVAYASVFPSIYALFWRTTCYMDSQGPQHGEITCTLATTTPLDPAPFVDAVIVTAIWAIVGYLLGRGFYRILY